MLPVRGVMAEPTLTSLLASAESGDPSAAEALFAALYAELHRLAQRELSRQYGSATIGATTLLHEAYLDISRREGLVFPDRARFMSYAARVMRGLIIDHVRRRQAVKRGAAFEITSADTSIVDPASDEQHLARLSDAIDELMKAEPALAQLVDLKFFCGFSFAEIAAMRGSTVRVVRRKWEAARVYLYRRLRSSPVD